jgi:hypothetical protein
LLIRNTLANSISVACSVGIPGRAVSYQWITWALEEREMMELFLVIHDFCAVPTISTSTSEVRVTIGVGHNFDDILDVTNGILSVEQIAHLHRLWADDTFPRNFNRVGDELIISARD